MAKLSSVKGLNTVITNMRRSQRHHTTGIVRGIKRGGLFVQRESQKIAPVDTGNLKASAFTREFQLGKRHGVVVGYTAKYAPFVHEAPMKLKGKKRPGGKGSFWDPKGRGSNKFLERPIREKREEIIEIVKKEAEGEHKKI